MSIFLYNDTDFKNVGDTKHHDWIGVVCDGTDSFADMIFRNNSYINTIAYSYYNGSGTTSINGACISHI